MTATVKGNTKRNIVIPEKSDEQEKLIVILLVIIGGILRFYELGNFGLWIDEALFGLWVREGEFSQEYLPVFIGYIFGLDSSEFALRSISALTGTLSIPAIYYVAKHNKLIVTSLMALFPLFVFWSRMARPYAPAILFIILSWRWWWMMIFALLCTPIAIVGLKVIKQKSLIVGSMIMFALLLFVIRDDSGRNFIAVLGQSSRWFTIPAAVILLYIGEFRLTKSKEK